MTNNTIFKVRVGLVQVLLHLHWPAIYSIIAYSRVVVVHFGLLRCFMSNGIGNDITILILH